jgi:hypothetical protein
MKNIVLIVIISAMFFSCKQEKHTVTPSGKKYKVTFNVAGFNQKQTSFSLSKRVLDVSTDTVTNIRSYLDILYYAAFSSSHPVNEFPLMQDSTMANMGTITDSLTAGTYNLYFWAGKKGLINPDFSLEPSSTFGYNGPWQDTFWNNVTVTVGTANLNQTVTLKRIVSKLRVKILDNIPANADSLIVSVQKDGSNMFLGEAGFGGPSGDAVRNFAIKIPASAKGQPNFTLERIMGNGLVFNVVITCKTASNSVLGTTTVENVTTSSNMTSELSGNLFGSLRSSQSFNVKIDTAWNTTPINISF